MNITFIILKHNLSFGAFPCHSETQLVIRSLPLSFWNTPCHSERHSCHSERHSCHSERSEESPRSNAMPN